MGRRAEDLTGKQFGLLTVLERRGSDKHRKALWLCSCSCNRPLQPIATSNNLKNGKTLSCGCVRSKHGYRTKHKNFSKEETLNTLNTLSKKL